MYIQDLRDTRYKHLVLYPFNDSPDEEWDNKPKLYIYNDHINFDPSLATSANIYPDNLQALIEALQTAAKIQQKLAAGEPVIIHEGRLMELPNLDTSLDMPIRCYIVLGWIAVGKFIAVDERTSDIDVMEAIQFLIDNGLYDGQLTDLGWQVLRVR